LEELICLLSLHTLTVPWNINNPNDSNNPNPKLSKAHLTTLNLNNFKMIEAIGLKIIASRSP
jgi:hypothetical protein